MPRTLWKPKHRSIWTTLLFVTCVVCQAQAAETPVEMTHERGLSYGGAFQLTLPYADFSDRYNSGWGLHAIADYPLIPLLTLTGDLGWNHFPGAADNQGIDVWEFSVGVNFALGVFYMGGETGYYTQVEEWSWVPSLGLRFDHWNFAVRFKAVNGASWRGLRVGYYF